MNKPSSICLWLAVLLVFFMSGAMVRAQDSTGTLRGTIKDRTGAVIPNARITVLHTTNGAEHNTLSSEAGTFAVPMLTPGMYDLRVEANGMAPAVRNGIVVEVGSEIDLPIVLQLPGTRQSVEVSGDTTIVELQPSTISSVIAEQEIEDLPLNGRRFSDLALLTPGVAQDPRGLTSASNGDLAFGGVRGFQTSFLVDGTDNNNGFFAQGRGRYRAPYQFSNEVVQEFRVSSNTFGADLGRSGGAVINVVTKSGSNRTHGSAFYYLRDSLLNARHPFTDVKPGDRQHQYGFTLGGPIKKDKLFFFEGLDQHLFHVPTVVRFVNGAETVQVQPEDYEISDQALISDAATNLSNMAGEFRSKLAGTTGFVKLDWNASPSQYLSGRLNLSRYYGYNNVYFDPASPVTTYAISENGEEDVATATVSLSLTSGWTPRLTGHLRTQFSRDLQQSSPNSEDVRTRIADLIDAFGRSAIMPRETREHRLQIAENLTLEGARHSWKFGGDIVRTYVRNFFPMLFGGQYIFDDVRVNRWTLKPQPYGLWITPLRAYAHSVARYYTQNFGSAVSHPDSNDYSLFVQDTVRMADHLAVTLGLRYDLQTFRSKGLVSNPLWPDSGKVPFDGNNLAPRIGFAYSLGDRRPVVFRGGYGIFYTRIPQIYNSAVEMDNGLNRQHLFLDVSDYWDSLLFPEYPSPLVNCPLTAAICNAPQAAASKLTTEVSTFSSDFRTPVVEQASVAIEKEVADRLAIGASYLYTHGAFLIRARDANLPPPALVEYPVFTDDGTEFTGDYYSLESFSPWQTRSSFTCPFAPCIDPLTRPVPELGAVNVFETSGSSYYHGMTLSARRRMTRGLYFRVAYTWARAIDNGQDALVVGRPATVQNSYAPNDERGLSSTDQRHRFVVSWTAAPRPFHREHPILKTLLNDWKIAGVVTLGSGRPVNARVTGDSNRDGNSDNDRLPGVQRNSYLGPDYATTNLRITRAINPYGRIRVELVAESFNVLNRNNKRVDISDDGFGGTAASFVQRDVSVGGKRYPAQFRLSSGFITPTNAYAPRQIQVALKLKF